MLTGRWFWMLLAWAAILAAAPAGAADPLTISQALQTALERNPSIQAARSGVDAAETRITQARSGYFPNLDFAQSFNQTTSPANAFATRLNQESITQQDFDPDRLNDPDAVNNFNTAVSLSWSLYNGGQRQLALDQAREQVQATELVLEQTRQNVIADTASAYVGLLLALKQVEVVAQSLETARADLKIVQSRYKSGFVVKSDLLRARVRIAELEQDRLQALNRVDIAQAVLQASMGVETDDGPIEPLTALEQSGAPRGTLEDWIATADTRRPELVRLRFQERIAQKEIQKSKGAHLPDIDLIGQYEVNSENFSETADNYTIGAVLRLNLFSGNRISAQTMESRAALKQVQAMQKQLALAVRVQTREAYLEAQSAWDRIAVARAAVDQADEALRIVRNRYRNGLLTIVGLLDSEAALQRARTRHFQAMHDYKVARIRLSRAAGVLDATFEE